MPAPLPARNHAVQTGDVTRAAAVFEHSLDWRRVRDDLTGAAPALIVWVSHGGDKKPWRLRERP
jgi:hypothetical protein